MTEILCTQDYSIFKKHTANRYLKNKHLKNLIDSIKAENLLQFRPILVNSNMEVIDGQNRLEAAKILQLPIYYIINNESKDKDIILLNKTQRKWTSEDYVNYYASKGNEDYIKIRDLAREKKMTMAEMLRIKGGGVHCTVRNGTMKFFSQKELQKVDERIDKIKEYIEIMKRHILSDDDFFDTQRFKRALAMVINNEKIDWEIFINKSIIKSDALKVCSSAEGYYILFLSIYNWKNKNKVYPAIRLEGKPATESSEE